MQTRSQGRCGIMPFLIALAATRCQPEVKPDGVGSLDDWCLCAARLLVAVKQVGERPGYAWSVLSFLQGQRTLPSR